MKLYDERVTCPHCSARQFVESVPAVMFSFEGRIYTCKHCNNFFRVGMITVPSVNKLGGASSASQYLQEQRR